jgi:hypothetical protein
LTEICHHYGHSTDDQAGKADSYPLEQKKAGRKLWLRDHANEGYQSLTSDSLFWGYNFLISVHLHWSGYRKNTPEDVSEQRIANELRSLHTLFRAATAIGKFELIARRFERFFWDNYESVFGLGKAMDDLLGLNVHGDPLPKYLEPGSESTSSEEPFDWDTAVAMLAKAAQLMRRRKST